MRRSDPIAKSQSPNPKSQCEIPNSEVEGWDLGIGSWVLGFNGRMAHPLVLALFETPTAAAAAARELRGLGVPAERVSIVTRSHDEEGALARAADASPGSELEDSRPASRAGELGAHLLAAIALVMPGIGPIVADGPLAAGLGEAAGHVAGGISRTLHRAGLDRAEAEQWESRIEAGAVLVGAHMDAGTTASAHDVLARNGAAAIADATWDH